MIELKCAYLFQLTKILAMNRNSKETWDQVWEIIKKFFTFIFVATIAIFRFIYEFIMLFDEDYQRKKRIQRQYEQKKDWIKNSKPRDIFNDWRLKIENLRPESTQEQKILQKMQAHPDEAFTDNFSEEEIEALTLWLLRILGVIS